VISSVFKQLKVLRYCPMELAVFQQINIAWILLSKSIINQGLYVKKKA